MRKPAVANKYNITVKDLKHIRLLDRSKVTVPLFWRNNAIDAWCISGSTAKNAKDNEYGTYNSFWIGVYDETAKNYAGKIRVSFSSYGGMCGYNFKNFFDTNEIDNEMDLRVQEMFMKQLNQLIDDGVFAIDR